MYFTHTVLWPGDPPRNYRHLLASLVPEEGEFRIPPAIFHYREDGHPEIGKSPFRFQVGKGRDGSAKLMLTALGNASITLLRRNAWKVTHLLSEHYGEPLADSTHTGYCEIRTAPRPATFIINHMVAERARNHRGTMEDPQRLRQRILEDLERQCALFGKTLPEGIEDAIYDIRTSEETFATPIADDRVGVGLKWIEMDAALDLKGPWHVGALNARGFGRIILPKRGQARKEAA